MNPLLAENLMGALILTYVFIAVVFFAGQRQGAAVMASFDNAVESGCGVFLAGYFLNAALYTAWA